MMPTELPQGRYLSCVFEVRANAGGQTRAMLMRNRILAHEGGVRPELLTLGPAPDHALRRERLLEQGLLLEEIPLLNIYEHYRDHGWGEQEPTARSSRTSAGIWSARSSLRTGRPGATLPAARAEAARSTSTCAPTARRSCASRRSASGAGTWPDRIQRIGADG